MSKLDDHIKNLHEIARERAASVEDAVRGIIGNGEIVAGIREPEAGQKREAHAYYAFTHAAVLLGNAVAALNEVSTSLQIIAAVVQEAETDPYAKKSPTTAADRDFLGKKRE